GSAVPHLHLIVWVASATGYVEIEYDDACQYRWIVKPAVRESRGRRDCFELESALKERNME
ncbi:hypothetical protein PJP06_29170, partial [Mycobacterium kansasii]